MKLTNAVTVAFLFGQLATTARAGIQVEPIGAVSSEMVTREVVISEDCRHIAYVIKQADGDALYVDGQKRGVYPSVQAISLSRAGDHVACWTSDGTNWTIRLDDKSLATFPTLVDQTAQRPLPVTLSADGKHWAYAALDRTGWVFSRDGVVQSAPFPIEHIQLSPDGSHYVYVVELDEFTKGVVVDGRRSYAFRTPDRWAFTPDAQHYACRIRVLPDMFAGPPWDTNLYPRWAIVVDGVASSDSFQTAGPFFVPQTHEPLFDFDQRIQAVGPFPEW